MSALDEATKSPAAVLSVTQAHRILADLDGAAPDERTIRRACENGQLPCVRIGKRILIPRLPFLALLGINTTE